MFSIYDSECCVCRIMKKVRIKRSEYGDLGKIEYITTEHWGYALSENEIIIEGFCPGCGIKFITVE